MNTGSLLVIAKSRMRLCILAFLCVFSMLVPSVAAAETRSLKLYFLHTGERAEITYKRNGKYVQGGLRKINRFLRDWRRNEPTKMDPRLLDLIWEVYKETGSRKHIHVISGYRSPATNSLLRKRGRGVAKKSQHTLGKALDFFIPGVSLRKLRNIGLRTGLGGVGYYPKSGSPFVHFDTGRVRHWPRMSRKELVRVFPKGKTLHVPSDGKPLARYNQAKAEYERKVSGRGKIVVAKAEDIVKKPSLFAKMLGRGGDDDEGATGVAAAPKPVRTTVAKPVTPATAVAAENPPAPAEIELKPEEPAPTPETILAALPASAVPIPSVSPRLSIRPTQTIEPELPLVEEPELPSEPIEDSTVEIASIVPVRRPEIEVTQVAALTPEPTVESFDDAGGSVAVFSASEIQDLRKQVYAAIRAERENAVPRPAQQLLADNTRLAAADVATIDTGSNRLGIIVPEPKPQRPAALAIAEQLKTTQPIEPGIKATGRIAVPSASALPKAASKVTVAALKPIDTNLVNSGESAIPSPSPVVVEEEEAEQISEIVTAAIAVPSRAERRLSALDRLSAATSGNETKALSLEQFKSANLDERLVGKWALAADTSIADIAEINPPAYGKNILRELPATVLSRGFSLDGTTGNQQGFSGSSIEFLDFTRF